MSYKLIASYRYTWDLDASTQSHYKNTEKDLLNNQFDLKFFHLSIVLDPTYHT